MRWSRDIISDNITSKQIIFRPCFLYEFSSASNYLSNDTKYDHIWTLYLFFSIMTSYRKWRHFRAGKKKHQVDHYTRYHSGSDSEEKNYIITSARLLRDIPCLIVKFSHFHGLTWIWYIYHLLWPCGRLTTSQNTSAYLLVSFGVRCE